MQILHTFKVFPPGIDIRMHKWNSIYFMFLHKWMRNPLCSANIEFFFEKSVRCTIKCKSRTRYLIHSQSAIQVKTTRALEKAVQTGAAELIRLFRLGIKYVSSA